MSKPVGASQEIDQSLLNRQEIPPPRKSPSGARVGEETKTEVVVKRTFSPRITRDQSPRIQPNYHATPSPSARKGMLAALKKEEEKK